jgi:hypothetical protein
MSDEPVDKPEQAPVRQPDAQLETALAEFDARERVRSATPKPTYAPFSLRDVDRRVWIGLGVFLLLVAMGIGGPPWQAGFWITLAATAAIAAPLVAGAVVLSQRQR